MKEAGEESKVKLNCLKGASAYGKVPESLNERITKETNSGMLDQWFQIALECGSVEEFEQKIKE